MGKPTWPDRQWAAAYRAGPGAIPAQLTVSEKDRLQPRAGKQLGGAPAVTRFTAASWTLLMRAAAPGRL
jgi:hypothetical protein